MVQPAVLDESLQFREDIFNKYLPTSPTKKEKNELREAKELFCDNTGGCLETAAVCFEEE